MRILLSKLTSKQKLTFLSIFSAAISINLLNWCYVHYTMGSFTHIPYIFWEGGILLSLITWNPKGIRLVLLALLGFFVYELILYNFFISGMSNYPFWYLFRDIYTMLRLDHLYAFLLETVLLFFLTLSLFLWKKEKRENPTLLDDTIDSI